MYLWLVTETSFVGDIWPLAFHSDKSMCSVISNSDDRIRFNTIIKLQADLLANIVLIYDLNKVVTRWSNVCIFRCPLFI